MTASRLQTLHGDEVSLAPLLDRTVALLGFGNQGTAHAHCLRDSGVRVVVGARSDGPGAARARSGGFETASVEAAAAAGDLVIMALPDEVHGSILEAIGPGLAPHATVGFLHGFSVHHGFACVPTGRGVVMVAPKGPGPTIRGRFLEGRGIPCLFAVERDNQSGDAEALGLAWAAGIGCGRAAVVRTTFAHETETDLFGEQTVLCGGMAALMLAAFETLVEAGYPPELAYMECVQEIKQVADLLYDGGPASMMERISNTAEFGAYESLDQLGRSPSLRRFTRNRLDAIRTGTFATRMMADHADGSQWIDAQRSSLRSHPVESAGAAVRNWMPWLSTGDQIN